MRKPAIFTILSLLFWICTCIGQTPTITTVAGIGTATFSGDGGPAVSAGLNTVTDICFDAIGNMYIADQGNHRVRKVNTSGIISTFAGSGTAGYTGDGGQATSAQLSAPAWLYYDNVNACLYISDPGNYTIRKVNASGVISTVAGTGVSAGGPRSFGGQATSTNLFGTTDIIVGPDKKIYFGEINGGYSRILVIDSIGVLKIFAGRDEPSQSTSTFITALDNPEGMMFDPAGNLYVCNSGDYRILKIRAQAQVTLVAGYPSGVSESGNGTVAGGTTQVGATYGIIQDVAGNIFFAGGNATIRTINTSGVINAFAGGGSSLGDGGPANLAMLKPIGLAWGINGNMYVADNGQNRVRMIGTGTTIAIGLQQREANELTITLFPNPANLNLHFQSQGLDGTSIHIEVRDLLGKVVISTQTNDINSLHMNISSLNKGLYYATLRGENNSATLKFVKE